MKALIISLSFASFLAQNIKMNPRTAYKEDIKIDAEETFIDPDSFFISFAMENSSKYY